MARAIQKLVRNGNSTQVTLPRIMLIPLGWLPGMEVVLELLEDNTIRIRPLEDAAFRPKPKPSLVYATPEPIGR
jgi:antitoxin component of MazEF toxin-antitoxin module